MGRASSIRMFLPINYLFPDGDLPVLFAAIEEVGLLYLSYCRRDQSSPLLRLRVANSAPSNGHGRRS